LDALQRITVAMENFVVIGAALILFATFARMLEKSKTDLITV
jgi:hypothetical protein